MDLILLIVAALCLCYGYSRFKQAARKSKPSSTAQPRAARGNAPRQAAQAERRALLVERWGMAEQYRGREDNPFPAWYYEQPTSRQMEQLAAAGEALPSGGTKGQASDLIGWAFEPEEPELEILRHFKQPTRGLNQTQARHQVMLLLRNEHNRAAWEARPANSRQREFFRFVGQKVPSGLTALEAEARIDTTLKDLEAAKDPRAEQWHTLDNILDEFDDKEFREVHDLRKPKISDIRAAIDALLQAEHAWNDIDADTVAEKLLELKPELERS